MSKSKSTYSRAVREAAEKIPDAAFADHPKIVSLRADLTAAEAKHAQVVAHAARFAKDAKALERVVTTTREEIAGLEAALPNLATNAFREGDTSFATVIVAKADLQKLAWQLEGAELALAEAKAQMGNSANHRASEGTANRISDLTNEISQLLAELKLEHARAAA